MAFTPYFTKDKATGEMLEQIIQIMRLDEALHTGIPAPLRVPMMNLVQLVNSYYSNKIEGNSSAPIDILRAEESRGFARNVAAYYEMLRAADAPRQGGLDGRGALSDTGLWRWTRFCTGTVATLQ
ncbi:hypothetical protein V0R52_24290 [Pseudomonas asiatica]|nr:hypothetical protein [Pseudomonas asiatica]MEE1919518.1 hypothetical protein [Pseudomonas asiatica]